MLEIFEIECINPPKLPDIPSESQILRRKEEENRNNKSLSEKIRVGTTNAKESLILLKLMIYLRT